MSGKYTSSGKRSFGSRSVFLILALVLVIGCTIGGTLAWLTAKTGDVKNIFVAGQIGSLALTETDTDQIVVGDQHKYIVIPGVDITKDPKVTYTPVSNEEGTVPVDAYVFVKVTASGWDYDSANKGYGVKVGDSYARLSFTIADGWEPLDSNSNSNYPGVFYREVSASDGAVTGGWPVIKDNKITVSHEITEAEIENAAKTADGLTFQAYAIQKQGFATVTDAWEEVSGANASTTP